jgi:hypothetical protein
MQSITNMNNNKNKKRSSKKLEALKFMGGSKIMKELQKTLYFAAYDEITTTAFGRTMTEKEQQKILGEMILGSIIGNHHQRMNDPDDHIHNMTLTEQMVFGMNQFSYLYENELIDDKQQEKKLRDCFFPQSTKGGKISIYANMPEGINSALLCAKSVKNPVEITVRSMMRGAKEVIHNGHKALAFALDATSEYRNGTLPSNRTLEDYRKYIRQCMFVELKGRSGSLDGNGEDEDDVIDIDDNSLNGNNKTNHPINNDNDFYSNPNNMPDDYYFTGMIAFFLWGFITDDSVHPNHKSRHFQSKDSVSTAVTATTTMNQASTTCGASTGNGRQPIRNENAITISKRNDITVPSKTISSPFLKSEMSFEQQMEYIKLQNYLYIEELKCMENKFSAEIHTIQSSIDDRFKLVHLLNINDRKDQLVVIQQLMQQKEDIRVQFDTNYNKCKEEHQMKNQLIEETCFPRNKKRIRTRRSMENNVLVGTPPVTNHGIDRPISIVCTDDQSPLLDTDTI